jgi:hypothetical protein
LEDGNTLQAVTFRDADGIEEMASVGQLQFLGNLTVNEWEGRRKLQFVAEEAVKL